MNQQNTALGSWGIIGSFVLVAYLLVLLWLSL